MNRFLLLAVALLSATAFADQIVGQAADNKVADVLVVDQTGKVARLHVNAGGDLIIAQPDGGGGSSVNVTNASLAVTQSGAWSNVCTQPTAASLNATVTQGPAGASAWPVSQSSQPLPTGAATSALQTTGNTALATLVTNSPTLVSGRIPVDCSAVVQPVSQSGTWTVIANAGTGTFNVAAASLPLPTGAATEAKQPALGTAGTPSADVISVQGVAGGIAQPVSGTLTCNAGSGTFTVSGTVTANAGTNLNTSTLATSANQTNGTQKAQLVDPSGDVANVAPAFTAASTSDPALVCTMSPNSAVLPVAQSGSWASSAAVTTNPPAYSAGTDQKLSLTPTGALRVSMGELYYPSSTVNSSSVQLAAGATFTGGVETILSLQAAQIEIICDQPYTLNIDQFIDAAGLFLSSTDTFTRTAGQPLNENVTLPGNYFRIRVTNNGASTTTTLNINTTFGIMATSPRANSNLGNTKTAINEINGTALSLGQTTMSASLPVTLASNQSALPVSQSGAWTVQPGNTANTTPWLAGIGDGTNTATIKAASTAAATADKPLVVALHPSSQTPAIADSMASGTITTQNLVPAGAATAGSAVAIALNGQNGLAVQVTGTYTGALSLQGTVDGTNWITVGGTPFILTSSMVATATIASATQSIYVVAVFGWAQVRVTGLAAMTGTATVSLRATQARPPQLAIAAPVSAVIASGTVTTVSTVTAVTTVASVTSAQLAIPGIITDVASAAITTTTTTATLTPTFGTSYMVSIPVTVVSGTTPTLDVEIQESSDTGTNWFAVYDFPRITATGFYQSPQIRLTGNRVRYVQTVTGTTPSFTRAINRLQASSPGQIIRTIVDRSIVLTTLNSTSPVFTGEGCTSAAMSISVGAITTTAPQLTLEGSDDGSSFYTIAGPLTAVASTAVKIDATPGQVVSKFVRARVSTAGVGVTAGFLRLTCQGT
jgi:hypothetical protein